MRTSALPEIAEDSNQSRWDRARLRLFLPIGLIVAVAVVCLIIAIVTSARQANEVTLDRDEQLLQQAIAGRAIRMLREVESVAATNGATEKIRETYDPLWTESRVGNWLQVYFGHDLVLVVDGSDHVQYGRARTTGDVGAIDLPVELTAILDFLRGRLDALPGGTVSLLSDQDPHKPAASLP